jgi:hypothetical protein
MRSAPWRWISGSTVPSSLTRRSTIWIDCSTVWRMRSVIAACGDGELDQAAAGVATSRLRWPLEPAARRAAATARAAWSAPSAVGSLRMRTSTVGRGR